MSFESELPSTSDEVDPYLLLGLDITKVRMLNIDDQKKVIKRAFREQIRIWHPDKTYGNVDIAMKIISAKEKLLDDERRACYHNKVDYDEGCLSEKFYRSVFWPDCYTEEQKKAYWRRMGSMAGLCALTLSGVLLTALTSGAAAPVLGVCGVLLGRALTETRIAYERLDDSVGNKTREFHKTSEEGTAEEPQKATFRYKSEEKWMSKMIVTYLLNGNQIKEEVSGSKGIVKIPLDARQVKVRFKVHRPIWRDIMEYDRFKKKWCKPCKPHVFCYETPPLERTFTISGNFWGEAVTRVSNEYDKETCEMVGYIQQTNVKGSELTESWIWEENSKSHREKFIKLHEYGRTHPEEIKEINDVRVCFSKEFLVGRGSDATRVFVGLGRDGYERAVKRLPRDDCACLAEQEKKILNEPNAVDSKHVVKYRYLDDKSDKDWVFLMMDLCEETLNEYVERSSLEDLTKIARNIIQQVLKGLRDLHSCSPRSILHRDLKPSNILRNVHGKWLIADFGISRILTQDVSTHRSSSKGTKDWKAVEACSSKDESEVRYKRESDIQVGGMVAFYIVTKGEHPFGDEPDRHRNLLDGNPVNLNNLEDPAAKDFISWMLKHDPKDRPTAKEALKHPYLLSMKKQFELLCKMGNQAEIKKGDKSSDAVRKLNNDPTDWRTLMRPDVLNYLCFDFESGKSFGYGPSWTECLRLIRNVNQHWKDRPRPLPQPEAFYVVGDPQEYFLKIFPNLPVVVHRIVRSCDWKERPDFKVYFTVKRE